MTDKKISELTSITGADVSDANDVLPIVDTSVATTKKITRAELFKNVSSVGIGTSSPVRKLTISGAAGSAILALQDANTGSSATDGFQLQLSSNGDTYIWNYENAVQIFGTNNIERMRIDSSGNVLCGSDGAHDIGSSTKRFRNLYLVGGAYLGGSTSANLLNDYEEGTWTPTVTSAAGTVTLNDATGSFYTKIGRTVQVYARFEISTDASVGTSNLTIGGLPFAVNQVGSGNLVSTNYSAGDYGTGGAHGFVYAISSSLYHVARTVDISSRATFIWTYYAVYTTV